MRFGKQAFGWQKPKSPSTKAKYIAESMLREWAYGNARDLAHYGITEGSDMAHLIDGWIIRLTQQQAA